MRVLRELFMFNISNFLTLLEVGNELSGWKMNINVFLAGTHSTDVKVSWATIKVAI